MKTFILGIFIPVILLQFCDVRAQSKDNKEDKSKLSYPHYYAFKDSNKLIHINKQFYKDSTGHLYQLTPYVKGEHDSTPWGKHKYFSDCLPQDLDPYSFHKIGLLFSKDKNFIYLCRPTSDGVVISRLEYADIKSFKIIKGSLNAKDDKHVYGFFGGIIKGLDPHHLKIFRDKKGNVTKMLSGKIVYDPIKIHE